MAEQTSQLADRQGIAPQVPDTATEAGTGAASTLSAHNSTYASTDASTHRSIQLSAQVLPQPSIYQPIQLAQEETGREETAWSSGLDADGRASAGISTAIKRLGGSDHSPPSADPLRAPYRADSVVAGALKPSGLEKTRGLGIEPESNRTIVAANLVSAKPDAGKSLADKVSQDRQTSRSSSGISSSASAGVSTDDQKVRNGIHRHGEVGALTASVPPQTAPGEGMQANPFAGELGGDRSQSLAVISTQSAGRLPAKEESLRVSAASASSPGGFTADIRTGVFEPHIAVDKISPTLNVLSGAGLSSKTDARFPQFAAALSIANSSAISAPGLSHPSTEAPGVSTQPPSDRARLGVEDGIQSSPTADQGASLEAGKSGSLVAVSRGQSGSNLTPDVGSSVVSHLPAIGRWGDDGTLAGQTAVTIEAGIRRQEFGAQAGQLSGPVEGSISGLTSQTAPVAGNSGENQSGTGQPTRAAEGTENSASSAGMVMAMAAPVAGSAREKLAKAVSVFPSSPERAITLKGSASAVPGAIPGTVSGTVSSTGAAARSAVVSDAQLVLVPGTPVFVSGQHGAAFAPAGHSEAESIAVVSQSPFQAMDSIDPMDAVHGAETRSGIATGRMNADGGPGSPPTLEMGYQDPTLGYVELHAHMAAGGVHASLTTQSPESGAALEGHLHSLADWMNERQTPIESLTVLPSSAARTEWGGGNAATTSAGGGPASFHAAGGGNAGYRDGKDGSPAASGQNARSGDGKEHSGFVPPVETSTVSGRLPHRMAEPPGMSGESIGSSSAIGAMQTMDLNDGAARIGRTISVLA